MVGDMLVLGGIAAAYYLLQKKKGSNVQVGTSPEMQRDLNNKAIRDALGVPFPPSPHRPMGGMPKKEKLHNVLAAQNAAKILAEQQRAAEAEKTRIALRDARNAELAREQALADEAAAAIKKQQDAAAYAASPAGQRDAQLRWEHMAANNRAKAALEASAASDWAKIASENDAKGVKRVPIVVRNIGKEIATVKDAIQWEVSHNNRNNIVSALNRKLTSLKNKLKG